MYFAPQAGHAPHLVPTEWADRYKGVFDEGYEAIRDGILRRQKELGLIPQDTELSPINPHGEPTTTGPDGQPWPLLDTVRPWDSLDRRRAPPVHPDGRGLRRLHLLLRRPAGTRPRLPRGGGRAGEHDHRRDVRQRRQRRGRAERQLQRVALLQRRPRHRRDDAAAPRRARHPGVEQPLQHRLGLGVRHAVPLLEALGRLRGRLCGHVPRRLAGQDRAAGGGAQPVRPRRRRRPDAVRAARHRAARGAQGLPAAPDRGRELRGGADRRRRAGQVDPVLRDARAALDLPRGLAGLHRAPSAERLGQASSRTSGSSTTSTTDRSQSTNLAEQEPARLETLKALWYYNAGLYNGLPLDDRSAHRAGARRAAAGRRAARPVHVLPGHRGRPGVGRPDHHRALVHDRRRRRARLGRRRGRALGHGRRAGRSQPVHQGRAAALHVQLGRHHVAGRRRRPRRSRPGRTSTRPSSPRTAPAPTRRCRAAPERSRSTWTTRRSARARSSRSPATSA